MTTPTASPTVAVTIGTCSNFAVEGGSTVLFSLALTVIRVGSVGNAPGTDISGNYELNAGTTQPATTLATQCSNDLLTAYNAASTAAPIRFLLTFDDGPSGSDFANPSAQVLDVLAHNSVQSGIKAIFFVQTRAYRSGATEIGKALLQRENDGLRD